ncbi:MAG: hypothetical protein GEU87_07640 [Alphaproteobacteria bacterium]|nr:hypothetical protein [Alphaproteobacteria bacterium]
MTAHGGHAARLALLRHRGNPRADIDYAVAFDGRTGGGGLVQLTFVPDKLLLEAGAFDAYLAGFDADAASAVEPLALDILDDINNEIVPRWVRVVVSMPRDGSAARMHKVVAEDRQPNWDNPRILLHVPSP